MSARAAPQKAADSKKALLAPVPCVHMLSARALIDSGSVVAFGSGVPELSQVEPGTRVLVYVSQTGADSNPKAAKLIGYDKATWEPSAISAG